MATATASPALGSRHRSRQRTFFRPRCCPAQLRTASFRRRPRREQSRNLAATPSLSSREAPPALKQELPVDIGYTPAHIAGAAAGTRAYAISQASNGGAGQVAQSISPATTILKQGSTWASRPSIWRYDGRWPLGAFVHESGRWYRSASLTPRPISRDVRLHGSANLTRRKGTQPVWGRLCTGPQ